MKTLAKAFILIAALILFSTAASAEYKSISENYETSETPLFSGSSNRIVDGDGENSTRFIQPTSLSGGMYRLGFETLDSELNGIVTVDFRAKAMDGMNYFSFDTRQNSNYTKTLYIPFMDMSIINKWRYYRIVIDFDKQSVNVYSSESSFDSLGIISDSVYDAKFTDATGFNMFRFINCMLDDVAIYSGGSAPYVKTAQIRKYGARLMAEYEFADAENDTEGRTQIRWERSENGKDFAEIHGEYDKCYTLSRYDMNSYIRAKIQPVSTDYPETGESFYTDAVKINSVADYRLTDTDGNEVFEITQSKYSLTAQLKNGSEFTAVIAVYNSDDSLFSVHCQSGDSISLEDINLAKVGEGSYHKVLFLDSFKDLTPIYDKDEEKEQVCKEVLDDLELSGNVKRLYDSGDYVGAVKEYRRGFFDNIVDKKEIFSDFSELGSVSEADELYKNNNITLTNDSAEKIKIHLGDEGAYNWIYPDMTYMQYGTRMKWTECLIKAYQYTGDEKYLKKWLTIWEDFDTNFYTQYAQYKEENGNYFDGYNIGFLRVEQLNVGMRAISRIRGLILLPVERYIDDEMFVKMITSQAKDAASISLTQETPNHFLHGYTALLRTAEIFDTKKVKARLGEYETAMAEFIENNYNADGGESEMSLHYNFDMFSYYDRIKSVYEGRNDAPEWYGKLNDIAENKLRMLNAVATPTGHNPSLAHDYISEDMLSRLRDSMQYFGEDIPSQIMYGRISGTSETEPAFTSIAFPYTGYYVMRAGWEKNSDYLFFMGSRFGKGHVEMNKLAVAYSAYGEDLLQSSPSSYSPLAEHDPYDYFHESSFGNNTVAVDGYSQRRLIGSYSGFSMPEESLWHTSDRLDYAEGIYDNGYSSYIGMWDERKNAKVSDVEHKRQVVMDKKNSIAVICDTMLSSGSHGYVQNWNFAEKFNSADMIDVSGNAILSNSNTDGAGIELYSFSPSELGCNVFCGDTSGNMYKGWYLKKYGTAFSPCIHAEIGFGGDGNRQIITLLMPKSSSETRIKTIEEIMEGRGFFAALTDGTEMICLLNCKDRALYDDITFAGDMLYMVRNTDGVVNGTAIGVKTLAVAGIETDGSMENFEFVIDGSMDRYAITNPEAFRWSTDGADAKPVYAE